MKLLFFSFFPNLYCTDIRSCSKQHRTTFLYTTSILVENQSLTFPKSLWKMCWRDVVCMYITAVAFEPTQPIYHWSNTSPTVSKDGMKMGSLKGILLSLLLVASSHFYPDLFEMFPSSFRGRYRQGEPDSFSIFKHKNILLGKFPLPNVPVPCTDISNHRAYPKDWFCKFYSWYMMFSFIYSLKATGLEAEYADIDFESRIKIFPFPLPTDFTLFRNGGHCCNSSKTRCCRYP